MSTEHEKTNPSLLPEKKQARDKHVRQEAVPKPSIKDEKKEVAAIELRGKQITAWINKAEKNGLKANQKVAQDILKEHGSNFYSELDKVVPKNYPIE